MPKNICHYCQQISDRSLEICTLPGVEHIVLVCYRCKLATYAEDREAKNVVHAATLLLAAATGDEAVLAPELQRMRHQAALISIFGRC